MMNFIPLILQGTTKCTGLCSTITSPYVIWFPIAIIITLTIMSILGIIYAISPLIGRNDLKVWVKAKLYDELSSIVLILIFLAFIGLLINMPVLSAYTNAGLMPTSCASAITNPTGNTGVGYNNLFFLSVCDLWSYNNDITSLTYETYWIGTLVSMVPSITLTYPPKLSTINTSISISLLPIEPVFHYIVPMLNSMYIFYVLVQVQYLLIDVSGLIFGTLMVVGLVARSFGVTRTFGGAMIAFAIGIGFVYPLMTSISYGFLDYALGVAGHNLMCNMGIPSGVLGAGCTASFLGGFVLTVGEIFLQMATGQLATAFLLPNGVAGSYGALPMYTLLQQFLIYGGLVGMGMTFIPLINITIVDTFIVDFSKSVGERMDFISLLTRIM